MFYCSMHATSHAQVHFIVCHAMKACLPGQRRLNQFDVSLPLDPSSSRSCPLWHQHLTPSRVFFCLLLSCASLFSFLHILSSYAFFAPSCLPRDNRRTRATAVTLKWTVRPQEDLTLTIVRGPSAIKISDPTHPSPRDLGRYCGHTHYYVQRLWYNSIAGGLWHALRGRLVLCRADPGPALA